MRKIDDTILYLSPYFWPEDIGSAPYCTELACFLSSRGCRVSTVAFRPHYPNTDSFTEWEDGQRDQEYLDGISIERVAVTARGSGGFKERLRNDFRYLRYLLFGAIRGRYTANSIIAYVPSVLTLYGAKVVKIRSGARIVAVVHDIESGLAASLGIAKSRIMIRLMQAVERWGLNFADEVIVLTLGMKEELEAIGCKRPITVLSIWGKVFNDVPIAPEKRPILMYSGNFGKKQNLDQLLPILERLACGNLPVDVVMRGDGSERDRIEAEMASRGISNVTFLPLAPSEYFLESLQSANIHLVPQALNVANYALPSKLFSIMSAGRPFVCIAEPDSPLDRIARESGAGICAPSSDSNLAFEMISDLLADPKRQREMGLNGRRYIENNMNRDDILGKYEALALGGDRTRTAAADAQR
ncbi:glycosyltransferase family 4 protein [Salipiger manganoxidans]|uniref:glycosyltransferase family 4 protein n=1 Tax=Salipiger marinus TaxID=555512 RepID=UPI001E2EAAD6|nr:glycosyltransferase family 4 protein [Salipiger manganoxidans]MCD1620889.1 glycosyltransferase family 4 protein [Salipiger manganoxidans]